MTPHCCNGDCQTNEEVLIVHSEAYRLFNFDLIRLSVILSVAAGIIRTTRRC